jgi:hypothetical protein
VLSDGCFSSGQICPGVHIFSTVAVFNTTKDQSPVPNAKLCSETGKLRPKLARLRKMQKILVSRQTTQLSSVAETVSEPGSLKRNPYFRLLVCVRFTEIFEELNDPALPILGN